MTPPSLVAEPLAITPEPPVERRRLRVSGPKRSDPRLKVASIIITVQVIGQVALGFDLSIAQILLSLGTCALIELAVVLVRDFAIAWPGSALLTGNGIALIVRVPGTEHGDWWSLHGWYVFVLIAVLSMASKYAIRVGDRQLFNPSNFGLVLGFLALGSSIADPQDLWWGAPSRGLVLVYLVIVVGGVFVTRRLALLPMAAAFGLTFAASTGVVASTGHCMVTRWSFDPVCSGEYWWTVVGSPEILIFLFFMITDPRTVPRGRRAKVAFGLTVGVLAGLFVAPMTTEFATKVAILTALVVTCAFRPLFEARVLDTAVETDGAPARQRSWARAGAVGGLAVAVIAFLLVTSPPTDAIRRDQPSGPTTDIDVASLPVVSVDAAVAAVTTGLEGEQAQQMLIDLADDLELVALAIEQRDPSLIDEAGVDAWRDARRDEVAAAVAGDRVETRRYTYESARIVVVGDRLSPQSLPQVGIRITGTERTGRSTPAPFEGTFTMTRREGKFLVSADDRSGPIPQQAENTESIPIDLFERAVRYGHDVDEGSQPDQEPLFDDVTRSAGVEVTTGSARLDEIPVPSRDAAESMVDKVSVWTALMNSETYFITGQAWGDVDGDGWPDLYLTNQKGPNALLINQGDGTFRNAPKALSAPAAFAEDHSGGATWVDVDNDGWPDLHVLSDDGGRLLMNEGGKRLVDVTEASGIRGSGKGMTASWADFDGDGDLDAYVANYGCQPCEPNNAPPVRVELRDQDHLFVNEGDGTFTDRTAWIAQIPATLGLGFVAAWIDYDHDGRPDLYLANDVRDDQGTSDVAAGRITGDGTTPSNAMIRNGGPGCGGWCFTDVTAETGTGRRADTMGLAVDDFDGDGRFDLFFTNGGFSAGPAGLLRNQGDGTFVETAPDRNANLGEWSWGASSLDVDNDGRRDLFVSVGYSDALQQLPNQALTDDVVRNAEEERRRVLRDGTAKTPWGYVMPPWAVAEDATPRTDQNRVLHQGADGRFRVLTVGDGSGLSRIHYGNATSDYDGDGLVDVVVGNLAEGYSLLRNRGEVGRGNHRVVLDLRGDGSRVNRDGVGTEVRVTDTAGKVHVGLVQIGGSLGSGSDRRLFLGLGAAEVAKVEVHWPDGTRWESTDVTTDSRTVIEYAEGITDTSPLRDAA